MIISSKTKTNQTKKLSLEKSTQKLGWIVDRTEDDNLKLRPKKILDYIGQDKIRRQLSMIIESAKIRGQLPDHILFYGQPGLGKTTLASLISQELNANFKVVAAPSLQRVGDLVSLLLNIEPNTVLFLDEIHRLRAPLEESLYTAMETYQVDLVMGKGNGAKATRLEIPPITLVGATTQLGKLSKPLKDRFTSVFQLQPYGPAEILELIDRNCQILKLRIQDEAKIYISRRCRGVPRITNNILKRLRDYQLVHSIKEVNLIQAMDFLEELGIYDNGLTKADIRYLQALDEGTAGVKTLSGILMEEVETIESVTEPYLIYLGLIDKSTGGRILTVKGRDYLVKVGAKKV